MSCTSSTCMGGNENLSSGMGQLLMFGLPVTQQTQRSYDRCRTGKEKDGMPGCARAAGQRVSGGRSLIGATAASWLLHGATITLEV